MRPLYLLYKPLIKYMVCKYFLSFCLSSLFSLLCRSPLVWCDPLIFDFVGFVLGVFSKKSLSKPVLGSFPPLFSCSFHVFDVRYRSTLIFYTWISVFPIPLLKKLSFLHCVFMTLLSKINWLWTWYYFWVLILFPCCVPVFMPISCYLIYDNFVL